MNKKQLIDLFSSAKLIMYEHLRSPGIAGVRFSRKFVRYNKRNNALFFTDSRGETEFLSLRNSTYTVTKHNDTVIRPDNRVVVTFSEDRVDIARYTLYMKGKETI